MRKVPECQNNKNKMQLDDSVSKCLVLRGGVPLPPRVPSPVTTTDFVQCFFGPRESRPSSHHTRLLPCFFLVPTFHSANEPPCFCWVRPKHPGCLDVLTFIRLWHLQFHWRNELPKMLVSKVPNLSVVSLFTSNFNPSPFFIGSAIAINLPRASHKRKPPWEPDGSARSKAWRIWSRRTKAPGEDLENQELWASSHSWEDGSLVWIFSNKILVISCIWSYPQRWAPHLNIQMLPPTIFCVAVHNVVTTEGQIIYKTIGK